MQIFKEQQIIFTVSAEEGEAFYVFAASLIVFRKKGLYV